MGQGRDRLRLLPLEAPPPSVPCVLPLLGSFWRPRREGGRAWDLLLASNCGRNCGRDSVLEGRSGRCSSDIANGAPKRQRCNLLCCPRRVRDQFWERQNPRAAPARSSGRASPSSESKKRCSPSKSHCFFEQQGGGPQPGGTTRTFRRVRVSAPLAGDLRGLEPRSLEGKQGCR